jgi:hypothetical protein
MKIHRYALFSLIAGVSAFAVSSCAYDPYYSGSSSYGSYGDGYGYGGSNFSTSFFVSTGNSRWAYDPYAGAYYDYTRRAYYDPYLYGYYPVGYRPRYVSGSPHPHGWSRGGSYCPPPSRIRSYNLTNYRDRTDRYRSLGRDWSSNVRATAPIRDQRSGYGNRDQRPSGSSSQGGFSGNGNNQTPQRGGGSSYNRGNQGSSDRTQYRSGAFGRGNVPIAVPPQSFTGRTDGRGSTDMNRSFGRQEQQRQERPVPQRMERPTPQRQEAPRIERGGERPNRTPEPATDGGGRTRGRG